MADLNQQLDELRQQIVDLRQKGCYQQALPFAIQNMELTRQTVEDDNPDYATSLYTLAGLYDYTGSYTAAEALYRQALEIRRLILGEGHPDCAQCLNDLAVLYINMAKYSAGETMLRQALEVRQKTLGEEHPDYASSLDNLGGLYSYFGHYPQAEAAFRQAQEIRRKSLGEDHPDYATSLRNVAGIYQGMTDVTMAESLYRQALEIHRKALGEEHPDYAITQSSLGGLCQMINNHTEAETLFRHAIEVFRKTFGEQHPIYASTLGNLGGLYYAIGNLPVGEIYTNQALEIQRNVLGEQHPDYAGSLSSLAAINQSKGNLTAAESLYLQASEICRKVFGENNYFVNFCLVKLSSIYQELGDVAKVKAVDRQAIRIRQINIIQANLDILSQLIAPNQPVELVVTDSIADRVNPLMEKLMDQAKPEYLNNLDILANGFKELSEYAEAEYLYLRVGEITRKAFGEESWQNIANLDQMATLYILMREYTKAETLYQQIIEIERKISGEGSNLAARLKKLAQLYLKTGNYTAAEPIIRQENDILLNEYGEDSLWYASGLNNLANLHRILGDYPAAREMYQKACDMWRKEKGEKDNDFNIILVNLAAVYHEMGNYAKAEQLILQSIELQRNEIGEENSDYATKLNNLATIYAQIGNYTAAERYYRQASEIYRKVFGEEHKKYAMSLNNLAVLFQTKEDYSAAETYYLQAGKIFKKALEEDHPEIGNINAMVESIILAGSGYTTSAGGHLDYALSLLNLAELYYIMGNYTAIEPLTSQAAEIVQKSAGMEHPLIAKIAAFLGVVNYAMRDYEGAFKHLMWAMKVRRQTLGEEHPDYAQGLINVGIIMTDRNRPEDAFSLMNWAQAIYDRMIGQIFSFGSESQRMAYLVTLQWAFNIYLSLILRRFPSSEGAVQAGLDLVLRRKALGAEALAAQREAVLSGRYPELEEKLRAFTAQQRQIAQKTLAGPGPEGLETHQKTLAEWNTQVESLEKDLARQIPEMNLDHQLRAANRQTIANALPVESALIEFVRFDYYDFAEQAAQDGKRWKPSRYAAFVLLSGDPDRVQLVDLGDAKAVDGLIAEFRKEIASNEPITNLEMMQESKPRKRNVGELLKKAVFDPLQAVFGDCRRLFLSPDGDLTRLPFETLPLDKRRFLIDEYHISYLSVGRDLLRFGTAMRGRPSIPIIIADPDFNLENPDGDKPRGELGASKDRVSRDLERSSLRFMRLPGTRVEGEQIANLLGTQPWCTGDALEARLKSSPSPRILHLATHGFFLEDQGHNTNLANNAGIGFGDIFGRLAHGLESPLLRSGLALAGANTWLEEKSLPVEAEDGILNAADVTGWDLIDTELVVLSACETGLGKVQIGEGVFGLRRSFVLAGAHTLVMSLWKVPDIQTQELMVDFYQRLLKGEPRSEALRNAQLKMKKKNRDPINWGAFICQGDPGVLNFTNHNND